MLTARSLSEAFKENLEAEKGKVILTQYSDIDEKGLYGDLWLIATTNFIEVYKQKGPEEYSLRISVSMDEVLDISHQNLVGCGVLQATTKNDMVLLLQYSNSYSRDFNYVARALNKLIKLDENERSDFAFHHIEDTSKSYCQKCGRIIPEWSESCPACIDKGAILKRLLAYAWPFKGKLILLTVMMLLGTALDLVPPYLSGVILIDKVLGERPLNAWQMLIWVVIGLFAAQFLSTLIAVVRGRMAAWLSASLVYELRKKSYEALQRLSLSYYDKRQTGSIMSRLVHDVNRLNNFLIEGLQYFLVQVLLLIGIGAILFSINAKLAFLVIIPAPIAVLLSYKFWKYIWKLFSSFWHRNSKMTAVLNDSLSGVRVIKAFAQEDKEIERFDNRSRDLYQASVQAEQTWATLYPWLSFVLTLGSLFVYLIGGRDVLLGVATVGQLVTFMNYIWRFYGPLQFLSRITDWLTRSLTSAERVFEILDAQPDVVDLPNPIRMPHIKGEVEFNNVTFGYDEHEPVLQNISFKIEEGEMLGVVGHSGAGKSTIINL
ncbi:MAG: ABC transporter transmembrane domain-containing protein, partial [Firmicutes bacterium]|nr:ABC transporter transmembrane domain-containing protein [Bacillota bacterium]